MALTETKTKSTGRFNCLPPKALMLYTERQRKRDREGKRVERQKQTNRERQRYRDREGTDRIKTGRSRQTVTETKTAHWSIKQTYCFQNLSCSKQRD